VDDVPDAATAASCVDWIEDTAVRIARAGGVDEDEAHFFGVAVREALLNALRHGRRQDGRCPLAVRLRSAFGRLLLVTVRDRGPGFDPEEIRDPCLPENLPRGNGRGVFYMRRFVDRLAFTFPRGGGVEVRLGKRLRHRGR
jgi:serine/threonine-protein kinase RsbW